MSPANGRSFTPCCVLEWEWLFIDEFFDIFVVTLSLMKFFDLFLLISSLQDKTNMPWWLGLSPKGIGLYDHGDKIKPRKVILNNGNVIVENN